MTFGDLERESGQVALAGRKVYRQPIPDTTEVILRKYYLPGLFKVKPPISNTHRKTNTMYDMHTLGDSKCMHMVHIVGFTMGVGDGWFYPT